jgi:hypothetical protein
MSGPAFDWLQCKDVTKCIARGRKEQRMNEVTRNGGRGQRTKGRNKRKVENKSESDEQAGN